jgi:hypothetical protein
METFLLRIQLGTEGQSRGEPEMSGFVTHVSSGHESSFEGSEELIAQIAAHLDTRVWRERRPS